MTGITRGTRNVGAGDGVCLVAFGDEGNAGHSNNLAKVTR